MMLSPEEYYEYFLKGKNVQQIKAQIRQLNREIRRLKKIIGAPGYAPAICPSEDVQLICYQEYLSLARQVLAENEEATQ